MNKKRIISALLILVMMFTAVPSVELQVTAAKKVVKVKKVKINKSSVTLTEGKTIKLKATLTPKKTTQKKVSWSTSNKKVAKVSKSGKVTGIKRGTATITVKVNGTSKKAKCKVTVLCKHKYKTVTVASTCVKNGYTSQKCERCGVNGKKTTLALDKHKYKTTTVKSTCVKKGYTSQKCERCGVNGKKTTLALGKHKYKTVTMASTCTKNGYTLQKCERCGVSGKKTTLALGKHQYKTTTVASTCTKKGYRLKECEICGASEKTILPLAAHEFVKTEEKLPICEKDGYVIDTCKICGKEDKWIYKAPSHMYEKIEEQTEDCFKDGYIKYKCEYCGDIITDTFEKRKHSYATERVAATCKKDGYVEYKCKYAGCGYVYRDTIPKIKCNFKQVEEVKASCTKAGYTKYKCSMCGDEYSDPIPMTEHEMWFKERIKADCYTYEHTIWKCRYCDYTEERDWENEYHHAMGTVLETHLPENCIDEFYVERQCKDCGTIYRKYYEPEEWRHEYELDHYTITPDCEHTGRAVFKCSLCEKTKEEDVEVLHDYEITDSNLQYKWEKCRLCGKETREFNDKEYVIDIGNGETATVVGHYDLETAEEMVVELNKYRKEKFRFGLKQNDKLMEAARIRAAEIEYQFGHERPNGTNIKVGENIMGGRDKTAFEITHDFSVSPGHNDNMLNANYQYCGCAIFCVKSKVDGNYGMNIVQMFSSINQTGLSGIFEK